MVSIFSCVKIACYFFLLRAVIRPLARAVGRDTVKTSHRRSIWFLLVAVACSYFGSLYIVQPGMLVDSIFLKLWYLSIDFPPSPFFFWIWLLKSVSKIFLSNYFCAMKKYGTNLFITHLSRKMKWDSYFLNVFCATTEILLSLEQASFASSASIALSGASWKFTIVALC